MLVAPKGLKYWRDTKDTTFIDPAAPQWAKDEFDKYMEKMKQFGIPDKDGIIRQF